MRKVFFDLETTGVEKETCRIIELAIKMIDEEGRILINKSKRYNPGVPITKEATEAHGITNEHVRNCPYFKEDVKKLKKVFEGATLIGYNIIVFDIPVLLYEFERCGVDLNLSKDVIDVMKLETALSPRTLSAVYEKYTGKKLEGAHDAMVDVDGTSMVLAHQMNKIKKDTTLNADALLAAAGVPANSVDFFGKLKYNNNQEIIFNFGKHKGLRILENDETKQYANWILNNREFSEQIKKHIREELKKDTKKQFTHPTPHKEINNLKTVPSTYKQGEIILVEDDLPF